MNQLSSSILLFFLFNLISFPISAQHESECFMLDSKGNPLDLTHLCRDSNFKSPSQTITTPREVAPNNSESEVFVVPIKRRVGGTPVIEVRFNDKYVFEMLVDTGASITLITNTMAKTLRIKPEAKGIFKTVGGDVELDLAQVSSIETGGVIKENLYIAIAPTMEIGLLGQNFSDQYNMLINSADNVIEFHPH